MAPIYNARVTAQPPAALIELHGGAADVEPRLQGLGFEPLAPGRSQRLGRGCLLRLAPALWVLIAAPAEGERCLHELSPMPLAADTLMVDVSDGWAHFAVTGPEAGELMAGATSLDLHPRQFPAEGVTFAEMFGLRALIRRRPDGFDVAVERSHAAYVADWFARLQGHAAAAIESSDPGKPAGTA